MLGSGRKRLVGKSTGAEAQPCEFYRMASLNSGGYGQNHACRRVEPAGRYLPFEIRRERVVSRVTSDYLSTPVALCSGRSG
jgi:hypothetical protein